MQSTSYASNSLGGLHSAEPNISTSRENIKTHFVTREGVYKQMTISEYSRPNRVPLNQGSNPVSNAPVRVSFLTVPVLSRSVSGEDQNKLPENNGHLPNHSNYTEPPSTIERICFNVGRELYVYDYGSIHSASDLTKPIDKRVYKGTYPTCHDFNQQTATMNSCILIIGFSAGQIQLIDPLQKEFQLSRLFNEDRSIDKSSVTCLRWVPNQPQLFIASHASGNMYIYNEEFGCNPSPPTYQVHKQGEEFSVHVLKSKASKNPVQKWTIGEGAINQFEFSGPDAKFMATVGQDGFLRVFNYQTQELIGFMKSYFGGLLCLSWSPDLKLIATGGEDDLLTVYSVAEKRIVCRGQGHKSWISQVAFDPYTSSLVDPTCAADFGLDGESTDDLRPFVTTTSINFVTGQSSFMNRQISNSTTGGLNSTHSTPTATVNLGNTSSFSSPLANQAASNRHSTDIATLGPSTSNISANLLLRSQKDSLSSTSLAFCGIGGSSVVGGAGYTGVSYRIGTVGHDTQLCLWDLTEDIISNKNYVSTVNLAGPSTSRSRNTTIITIGPTVNVDNGSGLSPNDYSQAPSPSETGTETSRDPPPKLPKKLKLHKRGFSISKWTERRSNTARLNGILNGTDSKNDDQASKVFGTPICPKMSDVPIIEPLVCKKIAHERLTVLNFRPDCLVTACQEGFVCTWARPGKAINRRSINSPVPGNMQGGTSV